MQSNNLEFILKKAKEHEKKYEWLQAAENYGRALNFLKEQHSVKVTEILEKMGFSFYKAAMQASNNAEFKNRMKLAIQTYEKESELLKEKTENQIQIRIRNILALIAYTSSCLETDPSKKKKLLNEWWNLKKQVKEEYEKIGDLDSVARVCNDLVEYSTYDWIWSSSTFTETKDIYEECINLAERSISILSISEEKYELARAYCFASWYYGLCGWYWESEEKIIKFFQKAQEYSNKSLELAHKIGDAWLLSQSYISSWNIVFINPALAIDPGQKILKYGELTKDNWFAAPEPENTLTERGSRGLAQDPLRSRV